MCIHFIYYMLILCLSSVGHAVSLALGARRRVCPSPQASPTTLTHLLPPRVSKHRRPSVLPPIPLHHSTHTPRPASTPPNLALLFTLRHTIPFYTTNTAQREMHPAAEETKRHSAAASSLLYLLRSFMFLNRTCQALQTL